MDFRAHPARSTEGIEMSYHSHQSNAQMRAQGMTLALLHRVDPTAWGRAFAEHPVARNYAGMTLMEMARANLEENAFVHSGRRSASMSRRWPLNGSRADFYTVKSSCGCPVAECNCLILAV
jgi:hypothetical protein